MAENQATKADIDRLANEIRALGTKIDQALEIIQSRKSRPPVDPLQNPTKKMIWDVADGKRTVAEILAEVNRRIKAKGGKSVSQARLSQLLKDLVRADLMEIVPQGGFGDSREKYYRRIVQEVETPKN